MLDLNDLVDLPAGWTLTYAADINDAGQIVGHGIKNGLKRAYLLTPIPEPCTLVLLCMGAALYPRRRRRR